LESIEGSERVDQRLLVRSKALQHSRSVRGLYDRVSYIPSWLYGSARHRTADYTRISSREVKRAEEVGWRRRGIVVRHESAQEVERSTTESARRKVQGKGRRSAEAGEEVVHPIVVVVEGHRIAVVRHIAVGERRIAGRIAELGERHTVEKVQLRSAELERCRTAEVEHFRIAEVEEHHIVEVEEGHPIAVEAGHSHCHSGSGCTSCRGESNCFGS